MKRLFLFLLLSSCTWRYGLSAAQVTGVPDIYCEPKNTGSEICYEDSEHYWVCSDTGGKWSCVRA